MPQPVYDDEKNQLEEKYDPETMKNGAWSDNARKATGKASKGDPSKSKYAEHADATTTDQAAATENAQVRSLFNEEADEEDRGPVRKRIRGYVSKKRVAVGGGIFVLVFGGMGFTTLLKNPLEFMHLGNFLKNAHMAIPDKVSQDLNGRFVVYALAGKSAEGRLGRFANQRADRWEKRLNDNGLKSVYQVGTQRGIGFEITDPVKAEPFIREMRARGLPIDSEFRNAIDINRTRIDGVRGVNTSGLSFRERNRVIRGATRSLKTTKVGSWLGARLLYRRSGTDGMFHPFRNRVRKWADNIAIRRQQKEDAKKEEENRHRTGDIDTDVGNTRLGRLRSRMSSIFRTAKGPAAVIATVCAAKGFSSSIDAQNQENLLTQVRMAATALGRDDQTRAFTISHPDLSMGEYALASENLYDPETDTSWVADPGIRYEMTGEAKGHDYIEESNLKPRTDKPTAFEVIDRVPTGFNSTIDVCNIISEAGEVTSSLPGVGAAMDWFDDRLSDIVSAVTGRGIDEWMQELRDQFASSVATTDLRGSVYGGAVNIGTRLLANQQMQMTGGRPLSEDEENGVELAAAEERQFVLAQKGFADRHLDITNIDTTAGRLAFEMPKTREELVTNVAKLPSIIGSMFTKPFASKANAQAGATGYDYGFQAVGFSQDELNDPRFENPFEIGQYYLDHPDELREMNNEYGEDCYAMKITDEGNLQYETIGEDDSLTEVPDKCKQTVLGANTGDATGQVLATQETKLLRYRFHIAYTLTSHALDCYEGLSEESCDQLYGKGIESDEGGGPSGPVDPVTGCPTGPTNQGIVVIEGTDVHQCIADQFQQLLNDARAAGISFAGSGGWRDPQEQIELRRQHCGTSHYAIYEMPSSQCSPPTARPGRSNHETGTAIDFRCNGGSVTRGSVCFQWLSANAARYGLKNLPSEPWHWSIDGT